MFCLSHTQSLDPGLSCFAPLGLEFCFCMSEPELPSCCKPPPEPEEKSCCEGKKRRDWLLWSMGGILGLSFILHYWMPEAFGDASKLADFAESSVHLLQKMWVGLLLGVVFVGILAGVPRSLIFALLGKGGTLNGILRATAAGVLLDLCSHGVLLVGMQLYRKGASVGQVMAFLIATPWNSFSMTVILWSLVGLKWTLLVLVCSLVVAILTGLVFEKLVANKVVNKNPYEEQFEVCSACQEFSNYLGSVQCNMMSLLKTFVKGLAESKMLLRWIFLGVVLSALIQTFISAEVFREYFGPTLIGLVATLLSATVIEVCSEGSVPLASDFLLRAGAPGNTFAFLMAGVATDYTEILSLRETTGSWKIALLLPLLTVPQVFLIALVMNKWGVG